MNSLHLIYIENKNRRKPLILEADKRYRLMVTLVRSDRPRIWNFKCFHCGAKVCELNNRDIYDVIDFYDPQNINNSGTTKHCKGTLPTGLPCQYSYFFNVQ